MRLIFRKKTQDVLKADQNKQINTTKTKTALRITHQNCRNKYVFNFDLNSIRVVSSLISRGSEFHKGGAAISKRRFLKFCREGAWTRNKVKSLAIRRAGRDTFLDTRELK